MRKASRIHLNYLGIFGVSVVLAALTYILFSRGVSQRIPASKSINIVLDIDYTIVRPAHNSSSERVFTIHGEKYILNNWARELVETVARNPHYKLYFFSGGKLPRNEKLLKHLKISTGESFFELTEDIFSFDDLTQVGTKGRFSERFKKRLDILGFDPRLTLLIDDNKLFAYKGEQRSLLWLGQTYHQYDEFAFSEKDLANKDVLQMYIPRDYESWYVDQNKLKFIKELLEDYKHDGDFLDYIHQSRNHYIPYDNKLSGWHRILLERGVSSSPSCQSVLQFGL